MSDYEAARLANIEANRALLSSLGIQPVRRLFFDPQLSSARPLPPSSSA